MQARRRDAQPRRTAPREKGAPGAGSVLFDPEAGVVTGLTRDRDSRSENRCSMCSAIHISSRTSLRPSSTREPSDPPPRVVLLVCFNQLSFKYRQLERICSFTAHQALNSQTTSTPSRASMAYHRGCSGKMTSTSQEYSNIFNKDQLKAGDQLIHRIDGSTNRPVNIGHQSPGKFNRLKSRSSRPISPAIASHMDITTRCENGKSND